MFLDFFGYFGKRIAEFFRFMDDGEKKCVCKQFKHIRITRICIVSTKLTEERIKAFWKPAKCPCQVKVQLMPQLVEQNCGRGKPATEVIPHPIQKDGPRTTVIAEYGNGLPITPIHLSINDGDGNGMQFLRE